MKDFRHPPTPGIKYCSILVWIESLVVLALIPLALFSQSNSNTETEKIIYSVIFLVTGSIGIIAGKKLKEAKKWAWITSITFCFFTLGSPFLPFSAFALYILFKKNSVMYFTLPHIPPKNWSEPDGVSN